MRSLKEILSIALFCGISLVTSSTGAFAEEFEDPDFDDGGGTCEDADYSVTSAAVAAFAAAADAKCECDPENLEPYRKCLKKKSKDAHNAFKHAARFVKESVSELKNTLNDEVQTYVDICQDSGDDFEEDPGEDFPEFE